MSHADTCEKCGAMCCRYVIIEIDEPEDRSDLEDIRWYLCHKNVKVYTNEGDWYVEFVADCRFIGEDQKCMNYDGRPRVCREHGFEDGDELLCQGVVGDYDHDEEFTSLEQFEEFIEKSISFKKNGKIKKMMVGD